MTLDVPFLRDDRIEAAAALLWTEFGRGFGSPVAPPMPVDQLLELHLRLDFEIRDLQAELGLPDVHGAIWVQDRRVAVDRHLDPELRPAARGRYHFTVAHEIGHWQLHRHLFGDAGGRTPDFVGQGRGRSRVEIQADRFAASLLMPLPMLVHAWTEIHGEHPRRSGRWRGWQPGPAEGLAFSRPLAELFEVSAAAMRYRLEGCGLLPRARPA